MDSFERLNMLRDWRTEVCAHLDCLAGGHTADVDELTDRVYDIAASINAVVADCAADLNDLEARALFGAANTTRSLLGMLDSVASF